MSTIAAELPTAVAKPLITFRIHNEAGHILCRSFQGVSERFAAAPDDPADFPSEHVALRVAELLTVRAQKAWAAKGGYFPPMSYLVVAKDWSHEKGGWWDGTQGVNATATDTAQLELGYELVAPRTNGVAR